MIYMDIRYRKAPYAIQWVPLFFIYSKYISNPKLLIYPSPLDCIILLEDWLLFLSKGLYAHHPHAMT